MVVETPRSAPPSSESPRGSRCILNDRALALWPRLDRRILARCGCDARRIARYVSRRTSLSLDVIQALIERDGTPSEDDGRIWFG